MIVSKNTSKSLLTSTKHSLNFDVKSNKFTYSRLNIGFCNLITTFFPLPFKQIEKTESFIGTSICANKDGENIILPFAKFFT